VYRLFGLPALRTDKSKERRNVQIPVDTAKPVELETRAPVTSAIERSCRPYCSDVPTSDALKPRDLALARAFCDDLGPTALVGWIHNYHQITVPFCQRVAWARLIEVSVLDVSRCNRNLLLRDMRWRVFCWLSTHASIGLLRRWDEGIYARCSERLPVHEHGACVSAVSFRTSLADLGAHAQLIMFYQS